MARTVPPALLDVAAVFAAAFVPGTFRILVLVPRLGELAAVTLEVPVVLGLSWLVAGWVLRRWPLPRTGQRLAMGGLAPALLMLGETIPGITLFGRTLAGSLAAWPPRPALPGWQGRLALVLSRHCAVSPGAERALPDGQRSWPRWGLPHH
jgi:hypothetical protein